MPYLITLVLGLLALVLSAGCTPDNGLVPLDRAGAAGSDREAVATSVDEGADASGCEDEEEADTGEYEDDTGEDDEDDCEDDVLCTDPLRWFGVFAPQVSPAWRVLLSPLPQPPGSSAL